MNNASPHRPLLGYNSDKVFSKPVLGEGTWIGEAVVLESACVIGNGTIIDHHSYVGYAAQLGERCLATYRAWISPYVRIGNDCVIGGFVGEEAQIGDRCRVFGSLVHHHIDPSNDWDAPTSREEPIGVCDDAFIGFGATVAAAVTIGSGAYVCANAVVTRDVPSAHVAWGVNKFTPIDQWKGRLAMSLDSKS